jgi:nucleotide-binding universal stress UspA family protein
MFTLSPWGLGLGCIFVLALGGFYWWMFRGPRPLPPRSASQPVLATSARRILVPISESTSAERAVEMAFRLSKSRKPDLVLVYVMEVPETLPLDAEMLEGDRAARQALETGRVVAHRYGCGSRTYLVRHRDTAEGILQVASEENVDAIVVSEGAQQQEASRRWRKLSAELMRRADFEVLWERGPRTIRPAPVPA